MHDTIPPDVAKTLLRGAGTHGLDIVGGRVRRTSSRFCLGVEHGDYNGTELFGVGTDRFIWLAFKANGLNRVRLLSTNYPDDGLIDFELSRVPAAGVARHSWARFPFGVDHILQAEGFPVSRGFDGVVFGNIPGGGMSRSASLCLNLILTMLQINELPVPDGMHVVELARRVENDYIGSPCGSLDQIMIYFANEQMGTHYCPGSRSIQHIPLGTGDPMILTSLDTGTDRPGLENSTYKIRRQECQQLVSLARDEFGIHCLADVRDQQSYAHIARRFSKSHPHLVKRLKYIFEAQQRFPKMLDAWRRGDAREVGRIFREDGFGLRDDYQISGLELESMCEIARGVEGVLGERMLGGGDKGASGALVLESAAEELLSAVQREYPQRHPEYADKFAVHFCRAVAGVVELPGLSLA